MAVLRHAYGHTLQVRNRWTELSAGEQQKITQLAYQHMKDGESRLWGVLTAGGRLHTCTAALTVACCCLLCAHCTAQRTALLHMCHVPACLSAFRGTPLCNCYHPMCVHACHCVCVQWGTWGSKQPGLSNLRQRCCWQQSPGSRGQRHTAPCCRSWCRRRQKGPCRCVLLDVYLLGAAARVWGRMHSQQQLL